MRKLLGSLSGAVVALLLSAAAMAGEPNVLPLAAEQLLVDYPGARVQLYADQPIIFYGAPMVGGQTPEEAAELWLTNYGAAFGVEPLELELIFSGEIGQGRFTVFGYQQYLGGLPVEYGIGRILVNNDIGNQVVYAAGRFAPLPAGGLAAVSVHADAAVKSVSSLPEYAHLPVWSDAELAVFAGEDERSSAAVVWKFVGEEPDLNQREKYTFFVDAASGALRHVRNDVVHTDVNGNVRGYATPGTLPDIPSNPPVLLPMPEIRVSITGGNNAYSNRDGTYTIPHGGTTTVTVTTRVGPSVGDGRWVWVDDQAAAEMSLSQNGLPPGPIDLTFNVAPSQFTTAQVNAFVNTNLIHNYFKDRAPAFTGLDTSLRANVNLSQTCNAFYDGGSINFFAAGGGCNNTSYSSVVAHEYGHHIVNRLGLAQGAFGEGYSDTCSMLLYDDDIIGRNFFTSGGFVRDPDGENVQYPCPQSGVHYCGQILGGVVWTMRENFGTKYGAAGLDLMRQLHVDWSLITLGGQGNNSAHPTTAIEYLTVNDDDGNLGNGTPDYDQICDAFGGHSIDCPEVNLVDFQYPNGQPASVSPTQSTNIRVLIVPVSGQPVDNSAQFFISVNGGPFNSAQIIRVAANEYDAVIPPLTCGSAINYYLQVDVEGGGQETDPSNAPAASFSTISANGLITVLDDAFESDLGWSGVAAGDDATTGRWTRNVPQATAAQPGSDHSPSGTMCWVTDYRAGSSIGEFDVDNGSTTLTSPALDLAGLSGVKISYWRWYSNTQGASPNADIFVVDVSNDGGGSWTRVETVGPTGPETNGGWFQHEFPVEDFVSLSSDVRVRFIASDLGSGSIVEAAVDDFLVIAPDCSQTGCAGDVDGDGDTDFDDLVTLLAAYGVGNGGDLDGDNDTDFDDLVTLLGDYGCQ